MRPRRRPTRTGLVLVVLASDELGLAAETADERAYLIVRRFPTAAAALAHLARLRLAAAARALRAGESPAVVADLGSRARAGDRCATCGRELTEGEPMFWCDGPRCWPCASRAAA